MASNPNQILLQQPYGGDGWSLRVTRATLDQTGTQHYRIEVEYPSVLPILERRIPLAFFRQGFDLNWNNHPYVTSVRIDNNTVAVTFDKQFADLYLNGVQRRDIPIPLGGVVSLHDIETAPGGIRFAAGADKNPFPFESGESPYFAVTIPFESGGPAEISLPGGFDIDLSDIRAEVRFYLVIIGTDLWYVPKISSPLLDALAQVNIPDPGLDDPTRTVNAKDKAVSAIETAINDWQKPSSAGAGSLFGHFLTPWLLGETRELESVSYDRASDSIVVEYVGPREAVVNQPVVSDGTPTPPPDPSPPLFDLPEEEPEATPGSDPIAERTGRIRPHPQRTTPGDLSKIDHIIVLMLENRSFDQVLGYLSRDGGRTDVEGLLADPNTRDFNEYRGRVYRSQRAAQTAWPQNAWAIDPYHDEQHIRAQMADGMKHFVSSFAERATDDPGMLQLIMSYFGPDQLKAYAELARMFTICDHWFCSHIGPTWPNRFVLLSGDLNRDARGGPETDQPDLKTLTPIERPTIFDHLNDRGVSWRSYEHNYSFIRLFTRYTFDLQNVKPFLDPIDGFVAAAARGDLPSVTFIEPDYIDLPPGNDDHPPNDMLYGQQLVATIVSALIESPLWERSLFVITYDEHGGFYDHVVPPEQIPVIAPDGTQTFRQIPPLANGTRQLGIRVPAFVVCPYVKKGGVAKMILEHTSIIATIMRRFCSPNPPQVSPRADAATDLRELLVLSQARPATEFADTLGTLHAIAAEPLPGGPGVASRAVTNAERNDDFTSLMAYARTIGGTAPRSTVTPPVRDPRRPVFRRIGPIAPR